MIVRFAQKRRHLFGTFAHVRFSGFLIQCGNHISHCTSLILSTKNRHNSFLLLLRLSAIFKTFYADNCVPMFFQLSTSAVE